MPGPTRMQNQTTQGVTTHIYLSVGKPFVCAVSKTLLPPGTKVGEVKQLVAGLKGQLIRSANATKTGDHPATYAGHAGAQTNFKTATGGMGAVWTTRVGGAVYSVTFAGQTGTNAAEMKRFFGSLKIR